MKSHLKIKIKSLAEEARIIRAEERKHIKSAHWCRFHSEMLGYEAWYQNYWSLRQHRLGLRAEQRAALLAYGFLRGRAYRQIEPKTLYDTPPYCRKGPNWTRVADIVLKFGKDQWGHQKATMFDTLKAWREAKPSAKAA